MKRKYLCLLLATVVVFAFTGCGKEEEPANDSSVYDDDEVGDLADITDDEDTQQPVIITVYYPDTDEEGIETAVKTLSDAEELEAKDLMEALSEYKVLPQDFALNSFSQEMDADDVVLKLDMPEEFSEYLAELDADQEALLMNCLTNTFLDNYDAQQLFITVDGQELVTDNASYAEALTFVNLDALTNNSSSDDQEADSEDSTSDSTITDDDESDTDPGDDNAEESE